MLCKCSGKYIDIYFILKITYYNNALKNNKDQRILNKNLDDLIGLKKEKLLPENNGNHMGLANRFGNFF